MINTNKRSPVQVLYLLSGVVLEHADNILFGLFAMDIIQTFFAKNTEKAALFSFAAFALYFFVRPIGALIFGLIGDKIGRSAALLSSMGLMSVATLGVGLLPSFSSIGIVATVLFLSFRAMQGISVGGEYSSAMTYSFEVSPPDRKNFYGSMIISATHFGGVIAAMMVMVYSQNFRISFILFGLVGVVSLIGRAFLKETHSPKASSSNSSNLDGAIALFIKYKYVCLKIMGLASCLGGIFYAMLIYFNHLMHGISSINPEYINVSNFAILILWCVLTPVVGFVIDAKKLSHKKVMRIGLLGIALLSFPMMYFIQYSYSFYSIVFMQVVISFFHMLYCTPTPFVMAAAVEENERNTIVAISYALGSCLSAGLVQFICYFMHNTFGIIGISFVFIGFAIIGFFSLNLHNYDYKNDKR